MAPFKDLFSRTRQRLKDLTNTVARLKREKEEEEKAVTMPKVTEKAQEIHRIDFSGATIARVFFIAILFLAGIWLVIQIREIILIFFVALLFAAALDPMVDAMERRKIPRWLGVLIVYTVLFFVIGLFVGNVIPLLATEIGDLALKIPDLLRNMAQGNISLPGFLEWTRPIITKIFEAVDLSILDNFPDLLSTFSTQLTDFGKNIISGIISIFNGLFNTLLVLILTFLMVWDEQSIDKFTLSLFPARYGKYISEKSSAIKEKIGQWLRGQVTLMVIVGLAIGLGLFIVGLFIGPIRYATTLAMFAGLLEIVPYIGPVLAWLIALPIVANQSFLHVILVTIVFVIIQQLENNVIVPLVMKKAVGLNPILSIISMMVGFSLLGVLGMVLAIPVATSVSIFVKEYTEREK